MELKCRVFVGRSPGKGRGVFAAEDIPCGAEIMRGSVMTISEDEFALIDSTLIGDYPFRWSHHDSAIGHAIALGYISLVNHAFACNARIRMDRDADVAVLWAINNIRRGEEITFPYRGGPGEHEPLWFDAV